MRYHSIKGFPCYALLHPPLGQIISFVFLPSQASPTISRNLRKAQSIQPHLPVTHRNHQPRKCLYRRPATSISPPPSRTPTVSLLVSLQYSRPFERSSPTVAPDRFVPRAVLQLFHLVPLYYQLTVSEIRTLSTLSPVVSSSHLTHSTATYDASPSHQPLPRPPLMGHDPPSRNRLHASRPDSSGYVWNAQDTSTAL